MIQEASITTLINAQHQHARFNKGHDTIQIFNIDAYKLKEIREKILNIEGVVSIHRM